jgi:hypothetical protein
MPLNDLAVCVQEQIEFVLAQREEILRAFVAKYGWQPDAIEQVEERTATGVRWYVRWRQDAPQD